MINKFDLVVIDDRFHFLFISFTKWYLKIHCFSLIKHLWWNYWVFFFNNTSIYHRSNESRRVTSFDIFRLYYRYFIVKVTAYYFCTVDISNNYISLISFWYCRIPLNRLFVLFLIHKALNLIGSSENLGV